MIQVLEYIMQHYTLFLGGAILILLAIIGYYADKTNFGQGKNNKVDEDDNRIENNKEMPLTMQEAIQNNETEIVDELQSPLQVQENENINNEKENIDSEINIEDILTTVDNGNNLTNENLEVQTSEEASITEPIFEERKINPLLTKEEVDKFNIEFNSILPEKEFIDGDLLSDIDDLNLDKTQKIDLSDVPDLDDIELPKIKKMDVEEDIWKF